MRSHLKSGQTATYAYYAPGGPNAGMLYSETGTTSKKTYYKYNERGQLVQKWGDVPYLEQRRYSAFGELTNLVTYRTGSGWTGSGPARAEDCLHGFNRGRFRAAIHQPVRL